MMLTQLANVARRTGYPVTEIGGWKTEGRPGGMSGVRTITCHHTANGGNSGDAPSMSVVRNGRPGLPGPLAHFVLGVSGRIYVIAAGRCNHAGVSRKTDYENAHAVGIEAEAAGDGRDSDWPDVQIDAYVRLCRALIDEYDLKPSNVLGHKETCSPPGRKVDPRGIDMDRFRDRVATVVLKSPTLHQQQEEEMAASSAAEVAQAVKNVKIPNKNPEGPDGDSTLGGSIVDIERTQDRHSEAIDRLEKGQAEMLKQLGLLATAVGKLTPPTPGA